MAATTPKMGLKVWNLLTDSYDHSQLAENFAKIDQHRHSEGQGNQIPTGGIEDGAISASKLGATSILDSKLASPNNPAYRLVFSGGTVMKTDLGAGTYMLGAPFGAKSGGAMSSLENGIGLFYFDDSDYSVAEKTLKLRLRAQVTANATKPTIKFTFGLYPVTSEGGADELKITLGTVVTGSTVEINEPAASTITSGVNLDFAAPADGSYVLGVVTSGALTNNSFVNLNAQLQAHNI